MKKTITALAVSIVLVGCDGNPFVTPPGTTPGTTTPPTTVGGVTVPGGTGSTTAAPTAGSPIVRYETDGEAEGITYDAATDTVMVNNLPFDADGVYDADNNPAIATLNGFQVYENNNATERRAYKLIRGQSASGETSFTIVRTGDYIGLGFGGFVYERDGGVVLPSTGQATYTGAYAGMRIFTGTSGLQFTTADATLEVDFEDFDATDAVEGTLTNRQYFSETGVPLGTLPTLIFATGSISEAGEIAGTAGSQVFVPDGAGGGTFQEFESGEYYAVLSGDPADEIVGIVIITGDDPNDLLDAGPATTVQETGGFIVTSP